MCTLFLKLYIQKTVTVTKTKLASFLCFKCIIVHKTCMFIDMLSLLNSMPKRTLSTANIQHCYNSRHHIRNATATINACLFEAQSCQISPQSDLKQQVDYVKYSSDTNRETLKSPWLGLRWGVFICVGWQLTLCKLHFVAVRWSSINRYTGRLTF